MSKYTKTAHSLDGYLGKLYHKMNMAVEYAIDNNFDYILQEDTQFIRKVLNRDLENIKIFTYKNIIHITSHLLKPLI